MPSAADINVFLSQLRLVGHKPFVFAKSVEEKLQTLGPIQTADRTLLMIESFHRLFYEAPNELKRLLGIELWWFESNYKDIKDAAVLDKHIRELVRITAKTYRSSQRDQFEKLQELVAPLKKNVQSLRSFRAGLLANSQWDIADIYRDIPPAMKQQVMKKEK